VEPFTAAKWGMAVGGGRELHVRQYNSINAFGINFYPGDAGIPMIIGFVGGTVIGFALGWVWYYVRG